MKLNKELAFYLIVSCVSLATIAALSGLVWALKRKRLKKTSILPRRSVALIDYKTIEKGSDNFANDNVLGQGGFGRVYRASLGSIKVAVKSVVCEGEDAKREFSNEIHLLGRIQHPNVISMRGYCVHNDTGFIVYELMQNGSLEHQLYGPPRGKFLTWQIRLKIALDAARGLQYLHEHCSPAVIHRDLKSSNILLDTNLNAKLSDFGLAIANNRKNNTRLKLSGTVGYVAPEYMLRGELTEKSDVYAYGVILLELLLGRRPIERHGTATSRSIVAWAMPQLTNKTLLPEIVDPEIKGTVEEKYLFQVAAIAVLCVQQEPTYRPLIADVVHSLVPLVPVQLGGTLKSIPHGK